jgi:hypothetical protein
MEMWMVQSPFIFRPVACLWHYDVADLKPSPQNVPCNKGPVPYECFGLQGDFLEQPEEKKDVPFLNPIIA